MKEGKENSNSKADSVSQAEFLYKNSLKNFFIAFYGLIAESLP